MIVKVNSDCSTLISINEDMLYNGNPHGKKERFVISIDCNDDRTKAMFKDPYFKVYDKRYSAASNIIRLYLLNGNATYHKGLAPFKITSDFIKELDNTLKENCTNAKFSGFVVYDAIWEYIYKRAPYYGITNPAVKIPEEEFIRRLKIAHGLNR